MASEPVAEADSQLREVRANAYPTPNQGLQVPDWQPAAGEPQVDGMIPGSSPLHVAVFEPSEFTTSLPSTTPFGSTKVPPARTVAQRTPSLL